MYFIASALTMQLQLVRCFSVWRLPVLYVFIIWHRVSTLCLPGSHMSCYTTVREPVILRNITFYQGCNQRNFSGRAEVTFSNDYDVIDAQSTTIRPQLTK